MKAAYGIALLLATAVALSADVRAATPQAIAVSGSVQQTCTAWTPNGALTFSPTYDVFSSTSPTGATSLTTQCTKGAAITFAVNGGANFSHAAPSGFRAMTDGGSHYLDYQLYQDSARSMPWGFSTSTGAGTTVSQTGRGNAASEIMTLSLYGAIPAGQNAFVSSSSKTLAYQDTVTVTVNY